MILKTNTFSDIKMWSRDSSRSVLAKKYGCCANSWSVNDWWSTHWSNRFFNYRSRAWIGFYNRSKILVLV
jgi:hypothetical protein